MAKRWTTEEIALLHKYYPTSGTTLVREFILRSPDTIQAKAKSLGLKVTSHTYIEHPELWVKELAPKNITPVDLYIDARTPILHKCDVCTCEWKAPPSNIRSGTGCPKCALISGGLLRRNSIEYVDSICTKHNLVRISEYTLSQDILVVESNICGHTWNTTLNNVQSGKGCSICNKGFGYISNKECYPEYAFLYVIHIILADGGAFIKIGVTTSSKNERVNAIKHAIKDLHSLEILVHLKLRALEALELENFILNDSNLKKYTYHSKFPGCTELLHFKEVSNVLDTIDMYLYEQPTNERNQSS